MIRAKEHRTDLSRWLEMIGRLRESADWPMEDLPIEMVQTHISVVLLGSHHVLKMKKPVDFGFLDYTTLEKRRLACEAEVDLNRRLCPDTYLGVRAIEEVSGQPRLSGCIAPVNQSGRPDLAQSTPVLDYGVWMRRLPSERMLDQMLAKDEVTEAI